MLLLADGSLVGSVAVDAEGNTVGGGAGITTNTIGGLGATNELFTQSGDSFTGANEAVGDFKDMVAASQSSDEGPPQDVTSVDANGCKIGSEFFNGQRCSPIETGTGDATGGSGGGSAFTPYNYNVGGGSLTNPQFSDMYTSNINFGSLVPGSTNMNFLKPAVNPYGNQFANGGIVDMLRNNRYR